MNDNWYALNKEHRLDKNKKYRENPVTAIKAKTLSAKWREENTTHSIEYRKSKRTKFAKRQKERYHTDIQYKLAASLRGRINTALNGNQKVGSAVDNLGCSIDELKTHIESKFKPGMTWDNHKVHGWHVDHIKPLSSFDLTDVEQFKEACNYKNLQPMWAKDNWNKGNKYVG